VFARSGRPTEKPTADPLERVSELFCDRAGRLCHLASGSKEKAGKGRRVRRSLTGLYSLCSPNQPRGCFGHNDSLAIAALAGTAFGAAGSDVQDALTVFKLPAAGAVAGTVVSGGPSFIPTAGSASCTCSH
jgi:hypothetical protein